MEKGNKKRLNKERRAQKPHKNTWARSGKAQEGRKKYCERETTEGKKGQRDRGCGNIEKAVMAEAHCCFIFLYSTICCYKKKIAYLSASAGGKGLLSGLLRASVI